MEIKESIINRLRETNRENTEKVIDCHLRHTGNEEKYPKYDNCDGINVNRTQEIPKDYAGLMGVPITFLHKYNPDQFEIVKFRKGDDNKDLKKWKKSIFQNLN